MSGPHAIQSACGPSCFRIDELISGEIKGSMIRVDLPRSGTIDTYVTCPPGETLDSLKENKWKRIVLWCCDVYGPNFKNQQLLMDWHAKNGNLVLSPDYFHGDQLELLMKDPTFDDPAKNEWIQFHRAPIKTTEDAEGKQVEIDKGLVLLQEWIPRMKEMFGEEGTKYGIIGFCFGAPYVVHYAGTDEVSCGIIVHPAFLTDDDAFKKIKQPFYASLAEQDAHFPPPRRESLCAALTVKSTPSQPEGDGQVAGTGDFDFHVQLFGGVTHGWALRGDTKIPRVAWAKKKSAEECGEWFERFLS